MTEPVAHLETTPVLAASHATTWADHLRFIRSWASDPLRVAAIAPSSHRLARLITKEIDAGHAPILELGPGTGVFTGALLECGVAEKDLTLVEFGPEFAELLQRRFPSARVLQLDAARLPASDLFPDAKAGAVVSGLGFPSMRPRAVVAILKNAFSCLRADGCFYQFTYGPTCPIPRAILERLGLRAKRIGGTLYNLPPAAVYRISRRSHRAMS
jgi:phosphatidylethanolamine/phosphatidyl-N-methylethanolamine N-methyltransferase